MIDSNQQREPGSAPRRSPLHDRHVALGAEIRDVGGHELPFRYTSELEEHRAVRQDVGLFDLSLMGEIRVCGPDAASFLEHTLISAIKPIALGKAKYTMIVQEDGGIIDDLIVYRLGVNEFMLVNNAGNMLEVFATLRERIGGYDVEVLDRSAEIALIAVQGPRAAKLLRRVVPADSHGTLDALRYYSCTSLEVAGVETIIARTGYTGEDGFELFPPAASGGEVWDALLAAGGETTETADPADDGVDLGVRPCGLLCRDILRLEAGMPLYGRELTRDRTPLEAGLKSVLGPTKANFIGGNALYNQPQPAELLVGLRIEGKIAPDRGAVLRDSDGNEVGVITSTKVSPTFGYPIAFAYVERRFSMKNTELTLEIDGEERTATVVPTPFYNRKRRK